MTKKETIKELKAHIKELNELAKMRKQYLNEKALLEGVEAARKGNKISNN